MKRVKLIWLALILSSPHLVAQTITPKSPFICNIDYARFYFDQNSGYLEIYYGFYPDLLTYVFKDGKFRGGVNLTTRLVNLQNQQVLIDKTSNYSIAKKDTGEIWYHYPIITQSGYAVPFGKFHLQVMAYDSLAPSRRDSLTLPIQISPVDSGVGLSDIELCKNIAPSRNKNDLFYKNALEVLPNPSLVFGAKNFPILFNYIELYNMPAHERFTLQKNILDRTGKIVRQKNREQIFKQKNVLDVDKFTVTNLPSGTYYFQYMLMDSTGQQISQTRKKFYLYNPHLEAARRAAAAKKPYHVLTELQSLSMKQLDREFQCAQYIATDEEIKMYAQLKTLEGKRKFLADFWARVARGRKDWIPINRTQYLARVNAANERYGALGREGWRTSRGRVFILYGPPDQVERVPAESGGKPYRIWYYYKIEDGVEFIFVDRTGYGEFELVHSTKRGELQDENWQRFLR